MQYCRVENLYIQCWILLYLLSVKILLFLLKECRIPKLGNLSFPDWKMEYIFDNICLSRSQSCSKNMFGLSWFQSNAFVFGAKCDLCNKAYSGWSFHEPFYASLPIMYITSALSTLFSLKFPNNSGIWYSSSFHCYQYTTLNLLASSSLQSYISLHIWWDNSKMW